LLEPDRYPFLYRALYAYLMLLPQSTAFSSLRGRLSAVNALGYQHVLPRTSPASTSSTTANGPTPSVLRPRKPDDGGIKWTDLLAHFRTVQTKHERARKMSIHHPGQLLTFSPPPEPQQLESAAPLSRTARRKTTGGGGTATPKLPSSQGGAKRVQSPPPSVAGAGGRRVVSAAPGRRPP
jgi:vacuole morphology and inheritance protein 14